MKKLISLLHDKRRFVDRPIGIDFRHVADVTAFSYHQISIDDYLRPVMQGCCN